ncbi:MAG: DNA polymerase III subunit chi [Pseudorhodobacter sp.]
MGVVKFYHLTRSPMERAAVMLLSRAYGMGWKVMLRGTDEARLDHLNQWLWENPKDSFLPHGRAGGAHDPHQPILLGTGAVPEGAQGLMSVEGAEVSATESEGVDRIWILFDGLDGSALEHARGQWKALTAAGIEAEYWSEEDGNWTRKQ